MSLRSDVIALRERDLAGLAAAHDHLVYSRRLWLGLLTDQSRLEGRHAQLSNTVTGSNVDDAKLLPTVNAAAELYLPSAAIGQFVSVTEAFIGDLISRWLVAYPYHFKGTVDVQSILSTADRPALLQLLADGFVGAMAYKSPRDWIKQLNAIVALGVPAEAEVEAFAELTARRDVFVHNRGIANDVYVRKAGPPTGNRWTCPTRTSTTAGGRATPWSTPSARPRPLGREPMPAEIAYASPSVAARPRRLAVDRSADAMTITFPLPPRWLAWANVVLTLVTATGKAALLVWVAAMFRDMARPLHVGRTAVFALVWPALLALGLSTALWTASGAYQLWRHLRLGHVPRTLTIDPDQLTLRRPGFRAVRRREWPTARVRSVRWRPVRDVFGRAVVVVRVSIGFDAGRPVRFTLASRQPEVVDRVRQGLCDLLPVSPT